LPSRKRHSCPTCGLSTIASLHRDCLCRCTVADGACVRHHIRPVCDIDTTLVAQIRPVSPRPRRIREARADPFDFFPWYREIQLAPRSCDNCSAPSRRRVPVPHRPGGVLFHDICDGGNRRFDLGRTSWNGLFDADHPYLFRPRDAVSHPIIPRVVVTTRGTGLQIVKHVSCAFWITTHVSFPFPLGLYLLSHFHNPQSLLLILGLYHTFTLPVTTFALFTHLHSLTSICIDCVWFTVSHTVV
jgi:hypothetical protein